MSQKHSTVFEKRLQDWMATHPRRWIATSDIIDVTGFISDHANKVAIAQLEAADRIIVSQDRIVHEASRISSQLSDFSRGIEEIKCTLDWGFSEIIWQLELQTETLRGILKVLQAPLDTQAKELRRRAEEAYRNGWIDDALEDFIESEKKNKYDFTILQSLGNIYLFHQKIQEKALEYYEKAAKYAKPYSYYHVSLALLHVGLVRYLQGDFQKAYKATLEAVELSPEFYEAHYEHGRYCAKLGKYDEAIDHLDKAIRGDRYYCVKADLEKDFDGMRKQLRLYYEELLNKLHDLAKNEIIKAQDLIEDSESYGVPTSDKFKTAKEKLSNAKTLSERGNLFDCWDAIDDACVSQRIVVKSSIAYLSNQIAEIDCKLRALKEEMEIKMESQKSSWSTGGTLSFIFSLAWLGLTMFLLFRGLFGTIGYTPFIYMFLFFTIPIVIVSNFFYFAFRQKVSGRYTQLVERKQEELSMLKTNLSQVITKRDQLGIVTGPENIGEAEQ